MTEFANGLRVLEDYRTEGKGTATGVNTDIQENPPNMAAAETANPGAVRGTVNLYPASVYALREPIAGAEDASVWSKIVASAETNSPGGQWFMNIPGNPSLLWFVVIDNRNNVYITQTALSVSGTVDLDTSRMSRLE